MWAVQAAAVLLAVTTVANGKTVDHITLANAKNCDVLYETISTQKCSPTTQRQCLPVVFKSQKVEFNRKCKQVTSVHCPTSRKPLAKRDAESDPESDPHYYNQWFHHQPLYHQYPAAIYPTYHQPSAVAIRPFNSVPAVPATQEEEPSGDNGCHKVTSEHCLKEPEVVEVPIEAEKCHDVTVMKCLPYEHNVPKTVCKPLVTSSQSPVAPSRGVNGGLTPQPLYNPFAYNFGWN